MPEIANINIQGLNTFSSRRVVGQNYLIDCNNVTVDQEGVIGTRRGQEFFGNALTSIKKIFGALSALFVNANSDLYYENAGTFTAVDFPDTATFDAYTGNKIQTEEANKSLFFTGERIENNIISVTDSQIKKLTSTSATVVNSGLDAPINLTIETITGSTFPDTTTFAIRVFYQYRDANLFVITSAVSDRVIALNDTGGTCDFLLKFQIPVQYNDNEVTIYYAISNNVLSPVTPDDNLFWGSNTVISQSQPINESASSTLSFTDFILKSAIIDPVDLYTNATQEGILQNNNIPLSALDIENYSQFTFYSNLADRGERLGIIEDLPLGVTIITLNTIVYQRASTSDYTASPVLFSGATTYEASLDLARAITATNPAARAQIVAGDYSDMGDVVGWVNKASIPADYASQNSVVDSNKNIYSIRNDAGTTGMYRYNPLTNTWFFLSATPAECRFSNLGYNPENNTIVSVFGLDAGNAQCPTYIYNIASNSWTTGTAPPARTGIIALSKAASTVLGQSIFIMCGDNFGGTDYPYSWEYNMVADFWVTSTQSVPTTGAFGRTDAFASNNFGLNRIYLFGGVNSDTLLPSADAFVYNLGANTWSSILALPAQRTGSGCTTVGGIVYIIGGQDVAANPTLTVYAYDPVSNTYSVFTPANSLTNFASAVTVNSTIYYLGGATSLESYRVGGIPINIQEKYISRNLTPAWNSTQYLYRFGFPNQSISATKQLYPAMVQFSKQGQPEAVPFLNNFPVGSASYPIKRISALRTSLIILKTDGLFQLNGVSPETFSLSQLDPTFILIASQSVAKLNNEIYCLSNKGVVSINESGPKILSYKIKDLIDTALATVPQADWDTLINGTAYEDDYKYILTIGDKTFTYNYVTDQWTIWHSGDDTISSWTVFNNYLYYANDTRVLKERKTLTSADYQDENGAGLEASIEFNNLELAFGKIVTLSAMQIMQREISDLTMAIQMNNDLGSPASFNKILSEYVLRVMPPNGNRMAFYYRPILSWDTEIVSPGGTFSGLKIEGLDFEFTISASNIR